jgi:hypothetical protein
MNAFDAARSVEQRSLKILRPFIQQRSYNGQFVVTNKGPLSRELQITAGDVIYNSDEDTCYCLEIKCEEANRHGNLFFETWSNLARFTPGWMLTLKTDAIAYHFIEDDELYLIPFQRLRRWAFRDGRIYQFPERRQQKYEQANDTWGRCVPIDVLTREISLRPPFNPLAEGGAYISDGEAA